MTELVQTFSRASSTHHGSRVFTLIAIFCGIGLLASLLVATHGVDLSPGQF